MKLRNARQSIHDSFALHLMTPEKTGGGGKFNSSNASASHVVAGMIIKATLAQSPHLRGTAIFLNAPDMSIADVDIASMKTKLWMDFLGVTDSGPAIQGVLVAHLDRIIAGYRSRVWDNASTMYSTGIMFSGYGSESSKLLTIAANQIVDILMKYDTKSLIPVWKVVDASRAAEEAENA